MQGYRNHIFIRAEVSGIGIRRDQSQFNGMVNRHNRLELYDAAALSAYTRDNPRMNMDISAARVISAMTNTPMPQKEEKEEKVNMCKAIDDTPEKGGQQDLFSLVDNVKEDRTPENLLFQVMLDLGVLLSSPIEVKEIAGKKVFNVADGFLSACFDHDVTEETVKAVTQRKPYYAVFRDSSMANDSVATNFGQIFETYSSDTVRKVL